MDYDELPRDVRKLIHAHVPPSVLAQRLGSVDVGAGRLAGYGEPPGLPMSVPGDGGHSWNEVRRLLVDEGERDREFRRRVERAIDIWREDHPGVAVPDRTRNQIIEDQRITDIIFAISPRIFEVSLPTSSIFVSNSSYAASFCFALSCTF